MSLLLVPHRENRSTIQNASYLLRFGLHNNQGVHGGTPLEMLHAILLGNFLYLQNCFFEQTGSSTQLGDRIDELCIQYGELYAQQSDRDLPKTKFSGGIRKGKLQAKEYTGILLVLLTAIQCRAGQDLLTDEDKTASNAAFITISDCFNFKREFTTTTTTTTP